MHRGSKANTIILCTRQTNSKSGGFYLNKEKLSIGAKQLIYKKKKDNQRQIIRQKR